jgi:hypothetical protein
MPPHWLQVALKVSRVPPRPPLGEPLPLRALRHSVQRLGLLVKPFIAKNSCSPLVNVKGALQSTQLRVSSVYINELLVLKSLALMSHFANRDRELKRIKNQADRKMNAGPSDASDVRLHSL